MSSPDFQINKFTNLRRSQRVCLSVPVVAMKGAPGANRTSEETRTLIVSAHGALLVLSLPVQAGELLILKHAKTQEELVCRVINVGPDQLGKREVGVEFERPAPRFWRIAFPPADWTPRSVDAKARSAPSPNSRLHQRNAASIPAEGDKKEASKASGSTPS
jgi:hypothetical protein